MINRRYFYNMRITIEGGNGSYSYMHGIVTRKSWLEKSLEVFDEIVTDFKRQKKGKIGNFEVVSFNRIN